MHTPAITIHSHPSPHDTRYPSNSCHTCRRIVIAHFGLRSQPVQESWVSLCVRIQIVLHRHQLVESSEVGQVGVGEESKYDRIHT